MPSNWPTAEEVLATHHKHHPVTKGDPMFVYTDEEVAVDHPGLVRPPWAYGIFNYCGAVIAMMQDGRLFIYSTDASGDACWPYCPEYNEVPAEA